jgi:uncharacterized protein YecE (DUF72 family)
MDFGKIAQVGNIDFTLPPDDPATARTLAAAGPGNLSVYVGCPVWQDDGMARKLCPKGTPKSKRLACYARQFNALELNATGYALGSDLIGRWAAETPPEFRFCPKVPRDITLVPNLDGVWDLFAAHCAAMEAFGPRLGIFLLQFPESFRPVRFAELERFLASRTARLTLALEVRHSDWFRERKWRDRLFGLMEDQGVASVITDTPGRRDVLHQRLTTPTAFIRFNGHELGRGDFLRLESWADRIKRWADQGLREAYFFPHLDPVSDTVDLAAYFLKSLKITTGLDLKQPRLQPEDEEEPRLAL